MDLGELIGRLGLGQEKVEQALDELSGEGSITEIGETPRVVVAATILEDSAAALLTTVRQFHQSEPLAKGIGREDLKGRTLRHASPLLFRAALDHLVAIHQITLDQDIVHEYGRVVTLGGEEARIRDQLEARFQALGLQAPSADEIIRDLQLDRTPARKILQLMVKDQTVVKIAEGMLVDRTALQKLIEDVRALKPSQTRFGVKEFKDLTGLSRKFAVPLLEYLDTQRVTRRVGDERIIL